MATTAGYSGTPLAKKLGIKDGTTVTLVGVVPDDAEELLAPLPDGVRVRRRLGGEPEVVVFFTTARRDLERRFAKLAETIYPAAACWIAWPKKASKVATDMTEDVVREVALPAGLVDVKVCAIDATWSGLKLVHRKERRPS
ncbi:MAG: DUF3052 domain-containing protein [Actinomycetota bacterium]|nr:DUF3052 domain-containing protein [Actinomycetota bacterium]